LSAEQFKIGGFSSSPLLEEDFWVKKNMGVPKKIKNSFLKRGEDFWRKRSVNILGGQY